MPCNAAGKPPALYHRSFETRWGVVRLVASACGVVAVGLPGESERRFFARLKRAYPGVLFLPGSTPELAAAEKYIRAYLAGKDRKPSAVPFHIRVTPFRFKVLEVISAIPYGKTMTYGEVAAKAGKPGAARAVGGACAGNPIPFLIPCHRVVATNGLGGFGGGLDLKRKLLAHEGAGAIKT